MDLFNQALQLLQSGSYVPQAHDDPYDDMHHEQQFLELPTAEELLSEADDDPYFSADEVHSRAQLVMVSIDHLLVVDSDKAH
jgi:hypothetical protein